MAKCHCKSDRVISKSLRSYTVGYVTVERKNRDSPRSYQIQIPNISLKGQWLEEAGFPIGERLTVRVMDGCLFLLRESEERYTEQEWLQRSLERLTFPVKKAL